jgi:CheY-like chemotaxis protein
MAPGATDVLIADGDSHLREVLRLYLEGQGYHCAEAADGLTALDLALQSRPRCLFLDLGMPGMNGLDVARRLRNDPSAGSTHIHCLTGRMDPDTRRRAADAGCELFLGKPAEPAVLLDAVRRSAWVDGLTMREAEGLLDWLERQGCTHLEVACPDGILFAARCLCPPDLSLVRGPDGCVSLLRH